MMIVYEEDYSQADIVPKSQILFLKINYMLSKISIFEPDLR